MEIIHFYSLLICKQQVLFHFISIFTFQMLLLSKMSFEKSQNIIRTNKQCFSNIRKAVTNVFLCRHIIRLFDTPFHYLSLLAIVLHFLFPRYSFSNQTIFPTVYYQLHTLIHQHNSNSITSSFFSIIHMHSPQFPIFHNLLSLFTICNAMLVDNSYIFDAVPDNSISFISL